MLVATGAPGVPAARAQSADYEALNTITIVGDDSTETGEVVADEQSISRARIERDEMTRSPTALAEIIARESGVQYQQSGGFGSFASISIRAASYAQTGVYLNGILLNSGGNPVVDLSTLEILNLGSVDLYRGSTPLQLGHAGIGGAVNLTTLDTTALPQTRVRLGIGSFSDAQFQLSHQLSKGSWDFVSALSHRQSDNNFTFNNTNSTPLNPNDDERQTRNNAQAERSALLLQGSFRHSALAKTHLTLQTASRSSGVPQWRNRADNSASYDTLSTQLQLSHIRDRLKNWNTRHSAYWHLDNSHYDDRFAQIGLGANDLKQDTRSTGVKTYWEYPTSNGFAGLSLDARFEKLDSTDRLDDASDYRADRNDWLSAVHYTWFDETDRWTITPAIRWQNGSYSANRLRNGDQLTEQDRYSQTGAQLGVNYKPHNQLQFSVNAGNFYRSPSFGELYGSIGLINGNADLLPEKGVNADIGVSFTLGENRLSGTLFASHREELIVTTFDSRGVGRPVNSGEAEVSGVELATQWSVSSRWTVRSNLTWQSAKSVDRRSGFYDKFLPGEAQLSWFTRTQYTHSRWTYWYEIDLQRKRFYDRANILPAPNTTQQSAGVGWQGSHWQANLSVQNLNNTNVQDFNGFPKPGRRWALTVTRTL